MHNSSFDSEATFPASLAVEAMRNGSYSTTAHALAEIVDNSYDASATVIHIAMITEQESHTPQTIAVLDNGKGMGEQMLRHCIQHGNHMGNGRGIGKFGVGLLSASFHQCKHLEVFSWDDGLNDRAVRSTSVRVMGCPDTLPEPVEKTLPDFFDKAFASANTDETNLKEHGTLVVWREIDRLTWRKADTLRKKLSLELGRIYRNFLSSSHKSPLKIIITQVTHNTDNATFTVNDSFRVDPVDPLFLHHWDHHALQEFDVHLAEAQKDPGTIQA